MQRCPVHFDREMKTDIYASISDLTAVIYNPTDTSVQGPEYSILPSAAVAVGLLVA